MSPRPYRTGQRQVAAEQTRARILEAASELLTGDKGPAALSMESVARKAGVARMTVYYQFESKTGLLEALFDDLAARGGMGGMAEVFTNPNADEALGALIRTMTGFYASGRIALRRLRGLAVMDPELETALATRGTRRRTGIDVLLDRLLADRGITASEQVREELAELLFMLTSFETYDALVGPGGDPETPAQRVRELVIALLDHTLAGLSAASAASSSAASPDSPASPKPHSSAGSS
jgi:AcrR family transcriptional regulator